MVFNLVGIETRLNDGDKHSTVQLSIFVLKSGKFGEARKEAIQEFNLRQAEFQQKLNEFHKVNA